MKYKILPERLIQNLTQPLHLVQQNIALPHNRLVLRILERRPCRLDDPTDLVNRAV